MINELQNIASGKIAERLTWQTAHRDQAGITKKLSEGEDIEEIYGLGETGLFDEFFVFLDKLKITNIFNLLEPEKGIRSSNVNFHSVVLIYIMRIVSGVSYFWHISPVLLQSQSLMRLAGFNALETREGTSNRGIKKKTALSSQSRLESFGFQGELSPETEDEKATEDQDKIRGPICTDSIAGYTDAIPAQGLEIFFNKVINILSDFKFFPK